MTSLRRGRVICAGLLPRAAVRNPIVASVLICLGSAAVDAQGASIPDPQGQIAIQTTGPVGPMEDPQTRSAFQGEPRPTSRRSRKDKTDDPLQRRISLELDSVRLKEALDAIGRESGLGVTYRDRALEGKRVVTLRGRDMTVARSSRRMANASATDRIARGTTCSSCTRRTCGIRAARTACLRQRGSSASINSRATSM